MKSLKQENIIIRNDSSYDIVIYNPDENTNLEVRLMNETVWLTQAQMSELFQRNQSVIARHISNIFEEGELDRSSNMQNLHNTLSRFKPTSTYSLDVIISVGYRVKSVRGTQFRQWANKVLKEYLLNGFASQVRLTAFEKHITNTVLSIQDSINTSCRRRGRKKIFLRNFISK